MGAATLRNSAAVSCQWDEGEETAGNPVAAVCQDAADDDLTCLNAAIDAHRSAYPDKVLAEVLGVSKGEFSKLRAGRFRVEQIKRLPPEIRAEYKRLLAERDAAVSHDEVVMARAAKALIDAIAVVRGRARMAKASL